MVDEDSLHNIYLYQRETGWFDEDRPASQARSRLLLYFSMLIGNVYSIIALRVKIDQWK
jgi:hypothetical protein